MTRPGEILIGYPGGDHVLLRFRGFDYDREGWLGSEIEVRCDGWNGRTKTTFMKGELGRFGQEIRKLHRALSGTAELHPLEPNLTMLLSGDGKGHISVRGTAHNLYETTKLNFTFEIDQTFLSDIAGALIEIDPTT